MANPEPLTERLLPRAGIWRWLAIAGWDSVPLVRLVLFLALITTIGLEGDTSAVITARFPGTLLNVYVLAIVLVGTRPVAERVAAIGRLGGQATEKVASRQASVVAVLLIMLSLAIPIIFGLFSDYGVATIASNALSFALYLAVSLLILLPEATALWVSVVGLLTIATLGRQPVPGTFPEDRSLGLKSVGQLLTMLLFLYVVILTPALIFGTSRLIDLLTVIGLFAFGVGAMLVAVWAIHVRMAAERTSAVAAARARYADAYRKATAQPNENTARRLEVSRMLLDGAESIHEWPFDERTQRIAGLLLSGVITGVVVRLVILIGLGV